MLVQILLLGTAYGLSPYPSSSLGVSSYGSYASTISSSTSSVASSPSTFMSSTYTPTANLGSYTPPSEDFPTKPASPSGHHYDIGLVGGPRKCQCPLVFGQLGSKKSMRIGEWKSVHQTKPSVTPHNGQVVRRHIPCPRCPSDTSPIDTSPSGNLKQFIPYDNGPARDAFQQDILSKHSYDYDRSWCAEAVGAFANSGVYFENVTYTGRTEPHYKFDPTRADNGTKAEGCRVRWWCDSDSDVKTRGMKGRDIKGMFHMLYDDKDLGKTIQYSLFGSAIFDNGCSVSLEWCRDGTDWPCIDLDPNGPTIFAGQSVSGGVDGPPDFGAVFEAGFAVGADTFEMFNNAEDAAQGMSLPSGKTGASWPNTSNPAMVPTTFLPAATGAPSPSPSSKKPMRF